MQYKEFFFMCTHCRIHHMVDSELNGVLNAAWTCTLAGGSSQSLG